MKLKTIAIIMATVLTASFASCKKDDTKESTKETKFVSAVYKVTVTSNDELLKLVVPTIKYLDAAGQVQTQVLTTKTWTQTINPTSLPANYGFSVSLAPTSYAEDNLSHTVLLQYSTDMVVTMDNGQTKEYNKESSQSIINSIITAGKLDVFRTKVCDNKYIYTYTAAWNTDQQIVEFTYDDSLIK